MRDANASNSLSIDRYELLRGEQKDVRIPSNPLLPINGVPVVPPLKAVEDPAQPISPAPAGPVPRTPAGAN